MVCSFYFRRNMLRKDTEKLRIASRTCQFMEAMQASIISKVMPPLLNKTSTRRGRFSTFAMTIRFCRLREGPRLISAEAAIKTTFSKIFPSNVFWATSFKREFR